MYLRRCTVLVRLPTALRVAFSILPLRIFRPCCLPRLAAAVEHLRIVVVGCTLPWRIRMSLALVISSLCGPFAKACLALKEKEFWPDQDDDEKSEDVLQVRTITLGMCKASSDAQALLLRVAEAEALDMWRLANAVARVTA